MKKFILCTILILGLNGFAFSQNSFVSAGSDEQNGSGEISYSIGQIGQEYQNKVHQGVQQPFEWYRISTDVKGYENPPFTVFPNPFQGDLTLESSVSRSFDYRVVTTTGKVVAKGSSNSKIKRISLPPLSDNIYFLEILWANNKSVKLKLTKI